MKLKTFLLIIIFFISFSSKSQTVKKHTVGLNIAQIPALSFEPSYEYDFKPYFSFFGSLGYSLNHTKSYDLNWFLTSHIKCGNCGVQTHNQTGGFLKTGFQLKTRKSFEKANYFFVGATLIISVVYEKADITMFIEELPPGVCCYIDDPMPQTHTKYIFGLGTQAGYSFKIYKNLLSDIGFQLAFPYKTYKNLYGYENYIPGIGYKDSDEYWFPTLIFNLKYTF